METLECPCEWKGTEKDLRSLAFGRDSFSEDAERCPSCGANVFEEKKIENALLQ